MYQLHKSLKNFSRLVRHLEDCNYYMNKILNYINVLLLLDNFNQIIIVSIKLQKATVYIIDLILPDISFLKIHQLYFKNYLKIH